MKRLRGLMMVVACMLVSISQAAGDPYRTDEPVELELPRLGGGTVATRDLRGQWVVLNYWATWCVPCLKEIPELIALHDAREDVTVLGLAYEEAEADEFSAFLDQFKPSYPIVLVDVYAPPEPFGAPKVLPTTVVLDPSGLAVGGFAGPVTREGLEAFIEGIAQP